MFLLNVSFYIRERFDQCIFICLIHMDLNRIKIRHDIEKVNSHVMSGWLPITEKKKRIKKFVEAYS
jgi:hypothetical protein